MKNGRKRQTRVQRETPARGRKPERERPLGDQGPERRPKPSPSLMKRGARQSEFPVSRGGMSQESRHNKPDRG
jgi:hypothetical protein